MTMKCKCCGRATASDENTDIVNFLLRAIPTLAQISHEGSPWQNEYRSELLLDARDILRRYSDRATGRTLSDKIKEALR